MKNWILQMSTLYRVQDKIICGHLFKIYSVLALINFKVNCLQLSNITIMQKPFISTFPYLNPIPSKLMSQWM